MDIQNKTFFVTGATGLIGMNVSRYLCRNGAHVVCAARSEAKARKLDFFDAADWVFGDMSLPYAYDGNVDYIIHTASPTDSQYFIDHPVETINDTLLAMNHILNFAKAKAVSGFVFTSSLEVYGICTEDRFLRENEYYGIDCTNVRNSYAEGKKLLECLAVSYCREYAVPVKIVRLCQTFGHGVTKEDNRVFAQFARSVLQGNDIVLATRGETKRSYCSVDDAVRGILTVLLNGESGEAYNIASDHTYCSIYDMAKAFAKGTSTKVIVREERNNKYLPTIQFGLDTSKAKEIGFVSNDDLESMISKFLAYYQETLNK